MLLSEDFGVDKISTSNKSVKSKFAAKLFT